MKIGGFQKLTLLDFPGKTACIVFLQGCNFRCPYCHNRGLVLIDPIEETVAEEDFFNYLKKRQGILDGVVVTGGEPLLHEEIGTFLEKIKGLGYAVKLDTNGTVPERLMEVCDKGFVDYVAMDIKHAPEKYGDATGIPEAPMEQINKSISFLLKGSVDYEFRTTLVKGIHVYEDMDEMSSLIKGAKRYYLQNFRDSGSLIGTKNRSITMDSFTEDELTEFMRRAGQISNVFIRNV